MDLANSKELSVPFQGFVGSYLTQDLRPPTRDVAPVLQNLTSPLWEPTRAPRIVLPRFSLRGWKAGVFQFCTRIRGQNPRPIFPHPAVREVHGTDSTPVEQLSRRENPVSGMNRQMYLNCTSLHHPRGERLFVISGHTRKETSKNTVSFCPVG